MMRRAGRGFTLPELLLVVVVAGILLTIGLPSFREMILMQRLRGINSQLVTDLQFARAEAAARNQWARVAFERNDTVSCYTIYTSAGITDSDRCDCRLGVGAACTDTRSEVRTVQVPSEDGVQLQVVLDADNNELAFAFDHVTGRILSVPVDDNPRSLPAFRIDASIDANRVMRTEVGQVGRVNVCAPASTTVGAPPCP